MVSHIRGKIQPSYALSETQALSCPSHLTPPLPPLNALLTLTETPSLGAAWITPPLVQMSETGPAKSRASSLMLKDSSALTDLSPSLSYFAT